MWSAKRLKEAGANCVKILLYYTPYDDQKINDHKHAWTERIGDECKANDIPFFLELVGYKKGLDEKGAEYAKLKPEVVAKSMAEFSKDRYGVDVLKVEVPVNLQFVEGARSFKGAKAYTKKEALDHYPQARWNGGRDSHWSGRPVGDINGRPVYLRNHGYGRGHKPGKGRIHDGGDHPHHDHLRRGGQRNGHAATCTEQRRDCQLRQRQRHDIAHLQLHRCGRSDTSDLDYSSTTALSGGSILDGSGNPAVLTLPTPGSAADDLASLDIEFINYVTTQPTGTAIDRRRQCDLHGALPPMPATRCSGK